MPTGNTSLLGLALPVEGELSGTWGDVVNDSITSLVDSAVAGTTTLSADSDATLTDTALAANQARQAIIRWTASNGATTRNITAPARSKPYIVINDGTGSIVLRGAGPTTGVTIVAGERCLAAWNGSDFVKISTSTADGVTTFSAGTTGLTPSTATSGAVTLAGTLATTNGGTGLTSFTANRVFYSSSSSAIGQSANLTFDGTTLTATGNAVISDNSSNAALRITQVGAGNALLVEDSANPDSTPFVVDASGNVGIGATTGLATGLSLFNSGSFAPVILSRNSTNDSGYSYLDYQKSRAGGIVQSGDGLGAVIFNGFDGTAFRQAAAIRGDVDGTPGTNDMPGRLVFSTTADGASSPTERMRIDNAGRVGIGTTNLSVFGIRSALPITGGTTAVGIDQTATVQSGVTGTAIGYRTVLNTAAAAFTTTNLFHYQAAQSTLGAGSAVTSQFGFVADTTLTGATNNYGFYSDIASGTGRWNFFANGTADNYFAGNVGIGTNSPQQLLAVGNSTDQIGAGVSGAVSTVFFGSPSNVAGGIRRLAYDRSNGNFNFIGGSVASPSTQMTLDSAGNLGIGTSSPGARLSVNTATSATAVTVVNSSGTSEWQQNANDLYITNYNASGAAIFRTNGLERGRVSSTGVWSLGAAPGSESLRVTPVASAVNYWDARGNSTGGAVAFYATGSDTNIATLFATKGTAAHFFQTGGGNQFVVANTASAVNYLQALGATTGNSPNFQALGSDTNIGLDLVSKGTGSLRFFTGGYSALQFQVNHTGSAVNVLVVTGGATGSAPTVSAQGSDTNINLSLTAKGTGNVVFTDSSATNARVGFRNIPPSGTRTSSYTLAVGDVGKYVQVGSGGSITIPDATFSEGDVVSIFNNTTGNITITCTITTAYIAGADSDKATMTLATRGVATVLFISGTICVVSGNVS